MPTSVDMTFVTTDVTGGTWLEWGNSIDNVTDMVNKAIAKLKPGECIGRLIICSHGAVGSSGFAGFDADTSGVEVIDGGAPTGHPIMTDTVRDQLARLRPYFCPDGVIEFRVCKFGRGAAGEKALQAIADLTGVNVTGPEDSIKGVMGLGGIATTWATAYPIGSGVPVQHTFIRGSGDKLQAPMGGGPKGGDIAGVPRYIPMPNLPSPAPPGPAVVPNSALPQPVKQTAGGVRRLAIGGIVTFAAAGAGAGGGLAYDFGHGGAHTNVPDTAINMTWVSPQSPAGPALNTLHLNLDGTVHMVAVPPLCNGFLPTFDTGFHIDTNNGQMNTQIQGGQPSPGKIQADGSFLTMDSFDSVKGVLRLDGQPQNWVIGYTPTPGESCKYNAMVKFPAVSQPSAPQLALAGMLPSNLDLGRLSDSGPMTWPLIGLGVLLFLFGCAGLYLTGRTTVWRTPDGRVIYPWWLDPDDDDDEDPYWRARRGCFALLDYVFGPPYPPAEMLHIDRPSREIAPGGDDRPFYGGK